VKAKRNARKKTGGTDMVIKILGTGCPKCKKLEENAKEAIQKSGIAAEVRKVTALNDIMKYNVIMTPALVVNEQVKSSGRVLSADEIAKIVKEEK
jgi:small redox-active disulfide protein 2